MGPPDKPPPTMDNVKEELLLTRMVIELFRNRRLDWLIIASLRTSSFRVTFYQFTIKKNR